MMSSSTWDSWTIPGANLTEKMFQGRLLSELSWDLDSIIEPGWYNIPLEQAVTGAPTEDITRGYRFVISVAITNRTFRHMLYFNYTSGMIAYRIYRNNAWRDWYVIKRSDAEEEEIYQTPDYFTAPIEYAHRGVYLGTPDPVAPMNTLPAFRLAVEQGYNGIETDVQITSDNVPVILHDRNITTTARNADGTTPAGPIYIDQITYAQANSYDYGIRIGAEFAGTELMKLKDFLSFCRFTNVKPILHFKSTITSGKFQYIESDLIATQMMYDSILMQGDKTLLTNMADYFHKCMICLAADSDSFGSEIPTLYENMKKNGNVRMILGGEVLLSDSGRLTIFNNLIQDGVIPVYIFRTTTQVQNAPPFVCLSLVNPQNAAAGYFHPIRMMYNMAMDIVE